MLGAIGARLLAALPWLPGAWGLIKFGAFGLLIILCAWLRHDNARLAREREEERAAHALTMARVTMAQDIAAQLARDEKMRKDAANDVARQTADADLDALRARYRAAVGQLRRQAASDRGAACRADLPRTTDAAQGADGPGAGAGVPFGSMIVTQADALVCADNTARLQVARDWALKVAVP